MTSLWLQVNGISSTAALGAGAGEPLLPLKKGLTLAFIGPHANSTQALLSNYHGSNTLVNSHSPVQAARAAGATVTYTRGCNICDFPCE